MCPSRNHDLALAIRRWGDRDGQLWAIAACEKTSHFWRPFLAFRWPMSVVDGLALLSGLHKARATHRTRFTLLPMSLSAPLKRTIPVPRLRVDHQQVGLAVFGGCHYDSRRRDQVCNLRSGGVPRGVLRARISDAPWIFDRSGFLDSISTLHLRRQHSPLQVIPHTHI